MIIIITSLSVILIDQLSKQWAQSFFEMHPQSVPVIDSVFHFTYVQNTGIAFGLFRDHSQVMFCIILASLLLFSIYLICLHEEKRLVNIAYGLIMGGGIGNVIDRLWHGWVIDFLDFRVWPVFNIADSCITIGVILVLWENFFGRKKAVTK